MNKILMVVFSLVLAESASARALSVHASVEKTEVARNAPFTVKVVIKNTSAQPFKFVEPACATKGELWGVVGADVEISDRKGCEKGKDQEHVIPKKKSIEREVSVVVKESALFGDFSFRVRFNSGISKPLKVKVVTGE